MTMFDFLPTVEQCCLCIDLKIGSILIAICGILTALNSVYLFMNPICGSSEETIALVVTIMGYTLNATDVFMLIAALVFLIGIITGTRITADIFICAIICLILVYVVFIIVTLISISIDPNCGVKWENISLIVTVLIWIYFMIVIRSYADEMF